MTQILLAHGADLQRDPRWLVIVLGISFALIAVGALTLLFGNKVGLLAKMDRMGTPFLFLGLVGLIAGPYVIPQVHAGPEPVDCSTRPTTNARLEVIRPEPDATFTSNTVPIEVQVVGGDVLGVTQTSTDPDAGHLHVSVDGRVVSMSGDLDTTVAVPLGEHTVTIEYSAADHQPFCPSVKVDRKVTIR